MWEGHTFFFFFNSHIFIPVSGIIDNPVERAYPTLRTLQMNAGLPNPGQWTHKGGRDTLLFYVPMGLHRAQIGVGIS